MTPAFSPFTPTTLPMSHQTWPTQHSDATPRDDLNWPIPQRSMSYSNLDTLHSHQYGAYSQGPQSAGDQYVTKPRAVHPMYPPPISTIGTAMSADHAVTNTHDTSQHPQSAGTLPSFPGWQQPYPFQAAPSTTENFNAWNTPHSGASPIQTQQRYEYGNQQGAGFYQGPQHGR